MSNASHAVSRLSSITPEQARDARARAWRFVFDRWEQKKAADKDGGEDVKKR